MPHNKSKLALTDRTFYSELDFGIEVFKEKIPDNGEDSYLYSSSDKGCIVGVFDGCGGSGAKKYEKYRGKTGAYMASRAVAGATRDWFLSLSDIEKIEDDVDALRERITEYLGLCKQVGGAVSAIKGSMSKEFPTTAAVTVVAIKNDLVQATCLWAGDSRCYLLDSDGLKQLSEDDLDGYDAMENLSADGVLTNVLTASKNFTIHYRTVQVKKPCILFTATDGCFGYLPTPMEFEYMLVNALTSSNSVNEFEKHVSDILEEIAGDDFTLCGVAIGYRSFDGLRAQFEKRKAELYSEYIEGLTDKSEEQKLEMWQEYRKEYYALMK